ncbi:MAG: WD40 repeat domain-containing protein [Planctomycetes bacterium]|nr:WD40 repeat domain-containing protein [Planctomycetota bacterium]MCW8136835.1 WD40 repeat domain-containing protein [Planctomycetota bacterium]
MSQGLMNPSHISFQPGTGRPTVCDTGNGRVLLLRAGGWEAIDDFKTEYWKKLEDGRKLYQVGPLATAWLDDTTLLVTDAGQADGHETIRWIHVPHQRVNRGGIWGWMDKQSNKLEALADEPGDFGEGNLTGLCFSDDRKTLYVCCHGNDNRTWVARMDLASGKLERFLSADDHGIAVNSPMQARMYKGNLLVLYSGAGGKDDGILVHWDLKARKPLRQWALPGLTDPMGFAQIPGKDEFVVTANNWELGKVNPGKLARVKLGETASIEIIADKVPGPVNCDFGPDGRLWVTCLGEQIDSDKGLVLAISGF